MEQEAPQDTRDLKERLVDVCGYGTLEQFRNIVSSNPDFDLNSVLIDGDTPLTLACTNNQLDIVKELLNNPKVNVNLESKYNYLPLQIAMLRGNLPLARELLAHPSIDIFTDFAYDDCVAICYAWTVSRHKRHSRINRQDRRAIVQEVFSKMSLYSFKFKCRKYDFQGINSHSLELRNVQQVFILVTSKQIKRIGRNSFLKLLPFDIVKKLCLDYFLLL